MLYLVAVFNICEKVKILFCLSKADKRSRARSHYSDSAATSEYCSVLQLIRYFSIFNAMHCVSHSRIAIIRTSLKSPYLRQQQHHLLNEWEQKTVRWSLLSRLASAWLENVNVGLGPFSFSPPKLWVVQRRRRQRALHFPALSRFSLFYFFSPSPFYEVE